jgi:hypothetical protein
MPLSKHRIALAKRKHILPGFQYGTMGGQDALNSGTEDIRRRTVLTPKEIPAAILKTPTIETPTITPRDGPYFIDRLHKWCKYYVFVSADHNPGEDEIPNPAYRSQTATFSSVQDAYDYAKSHLVPLLASDNERVAVIIIGGFYEENLILDYTQIDIVGLGRPRIYGNATVLPATGADNMFRLDNIEFWGKDGSYALTLNTAGEYPSTLVSMVEIERCWIHGPDGGLDARMRSVVYRSVIETDYKDSSYTNIDTAAAKVVMTSHLWTEFTECTISGVIDLRGGALPNKGAAILALNNIIPGVYNLAGDTGVAVRHSTILGYYRVQCWNLFFSHCDMYGGRKDLGSDWLGYVQGDSASGVHGTVTFDHCGCSCRYIAGENDMTPVPLAKVTDVYIQHTKQLYNNLGAFAGQTVASVAAFGGVIPFGGFGNTHVFHSATWRTFWNAFAGVEVAVTNVNSDVGLPIAAVPTLYIRYTRY